MNILAKITGISPIAKKDGSTSASLLRVSVQWTDENNRLQERQPALSLVGKDGVKTSQAFLDKIIEALKNKTDIYLRLSETPDRTDESQTNLWLNPGVDTSQDITDGDAAAELVGKMLEAIPEPDLNPEPDDESAEINL